MQFKLVSDFKPKGSQPEAIKQLCKGLDKPKSTQTLLGVTGSGKTFTVAHVIEQLQKPTLVVAHNKTLAAQLYHEFKEFFPENRVEFFEDQLVALQKRVEELEIETSKEE